jgi:CBS domain-containing protein
MSKAGIRMREEQAEALLMEEDIKMLTAKDAMIKPVLIYSEDNVEKILRKLKKEHINACIVVNKDKKFIGEISDNDIIKLFLQQVKYEPLVQILNHGYRREFLYKTAKDMINKHKSFVRKNTPINDVIELVFKEGFEYIPVLNDADKVVGVVTPSSLIGLLKDY